MKSSFEKRKTKAMKFCRIYGTPSKELTSYYRNYKRREKETKKGYLRKYWLNISQV